MAYSPSYDYNYSQADVAHEYAYLQPDVGYKDAEAGRLLGEIRVFFFFIAGECVGLPALVWALRVLYGHHKSGGRTSVFIIMLLLNDLLGLLLGLYIAVTLLTEGFSWSPQTKHKQISNRSDSFTPQQNLVQCSSILL
ncbi:hypothetical protein MHYP_G00244850 [Metynnis hypsauchen]